MATTLDSYRLQLNNSDIVNRDVKFRGALHYDLISKTYLNNQRTLKNITETNLETTNPNDSNILSNKSIMTPLVERGDLEQSILGLELNAYTAGRGINDIKIYQELIKTI